MAYLGDIARRLKKQLGTEIAGQYDEDMKIDYIQLRGKPPAQKPGNVEQNKGIIYVGGWNLHQKPPKGCCAGSMSRSGVQGNYGTGPSGKCTLPGPGL